MTNYRYDFNLHTLQELPSNDARLFLDIIVNKALLQTQAIQYRNNNSDWIDITKWPVTVINNNPQLGNGNLIINFTTDLTFTSSDQYFICGSHNIQFGLTSLKDDGTIPIIDISCNKGYPGLISNNNYYSKTGVCICASLRCKVWVK